MELKDILAISGQGGLFKFISQGRNGIIVEHLETKNRINASATAKISALEDIAIYTYDEDMPLSDIFRTIHTKENGGASISHKAAAKELKAYFKEVVPEYDEERVYISDIKKVFNWYNTLEKLDMLVLKTEDDSTEETTGSAEETKE